MNVFPKTSHQKDIFLLQLLHSGRLSVTWFLTKIFRSRQFWILAPFSLHGKCLVPGSTRYYLIYGTSPCSDFGTFKTAFFVENSIWKPHFVRCFRPKIARRSHFRAPNNCISTSKGNRRSVTLFWFETEPKWRMWETQWKHVFCLHDNFWPFGPTPPPPEGTKFGNILVFLRFFF